MPNQTPAGSSKHPITLNLPTDPITWQRFAVEYEYPVFFTEDIFSPSNPIFKDNVCQLEPEKRHRLIFFIDDGVLTTSPNLGIAIRKYADVHVTQIDLVCDPITMPGGEAIKSNFQYIKKMQELVADHRMDRHSFIVGIGGGALLDAVGFVAATAHRGIRHIRVPTTVLAQNDSGVGVKNSVNSFGQKNYIGTFSPPFSVVNDYAFIRALNARDKKAGMAEAVKVALIRDFEFYNWLEQNANYLTAFNDEIMKVMIRRCAELHLQQIANGGDPFEFGSARPLDYGHWAAHKLEGLTQYKLRHGEAVAIGLALDTHYSAAIGLLPMDSAEKVCSLLERLGFRLWHSALDLRSADSKLEIINGLNDFREHLGGRLTVTLLSEIGVGIEVYEMDHLLVEKSVQWLKKRDSVNSN
jgi:3-dehydroquinate synthase